MRIAGSLFLTVSLMTGSAMLAQGPPDQKSPDLQQQSHPENNPESQAHKPKSDVSQPSSNQSPDTEQEKASQRPGKRRKHGKVKDSVHQAHGTPHPENSTDPAAK